MTREERIAILKEELLNTKPFLCHERALELTRAFKENENESYIVTIHNIRFTPETAEGERGTKNIAALIRSYFEVGGFHMQINVV